MTEKTDSDCGNAHRDRDRYKDRQADGLTDR